MRSIEVVVGDSLSNQLISALDLYSRILCGQYSDLMQICAPVGVSWLEYYSPSVVRLAARGLRENLVGIEAAELSSSFGIWSDETHIRAKRAFDMQQCVRYIIAWTRKPDGDWTNEFDFPYIHGEWDISGWNLNGHFFNRWYDSCADQGLLPKRRVGSDWSCPIRAEISVDRIKFLFLDDMMGEIIDDAVQSYISACEGRLYDVFRTIYTRVDASLLDNHEVTQDIFTIQDVLDKINEHPKSCAYINIRHMIDRGFVGDWNERGEDDEW